MTCLKENEDQFLAFSLNAAAPVGTVEIALDRYELSDHFMPAQEGLPEAVEAVGMHVQCRLVLPACASPTRISGICFLIPWILLASLSAMPRLHCCAECPLLLYAHGARRVQRQNLVHILCLIRSQQLGCLTVAEMACFAKIS